MKTKKEDEKIVRLNKSSLVVVLIIIFSVISLVFASTFIDKSQPDFDKGTYNQTQYNTTNNAVQLNLSYNNGTYTSQIFNTGSNVSLNNLSWTYQRIQCPENMAYINKLNGYCIDKYEASTPGCEIVMNNCANWTGAGFCPTICVPTVGILGGVNSDTGTTALAYSKVNVAPLVGVSQKQARQMCANAGKHLCTSEEWLGAADINGVYYNLPLDLAASPNFCNTGGSTRCNYSYLGVYNGGNYACNTSQYVSGLSNCSSSEGVYDMTGNVWEWTNETISYTKTCGDTKVSGYCYWNGTAWLATTNAQTAKYGNDYVYFLGNSSTGKAVLRGGFWDHTGYAGPFCAHLSHAPSTVANYLGFRCCSS